MSRPKPAGPGEQAGGGEAVSGSGSEGLSDLDCYAILSVGGMGGHNGFTLADYAALSDRQILALLSIEWDDKGHLIQEKGPAGRERAGTPARVASELPPLEELGLDDRTLSEALELRPLAGPYYLGMFWQCWSNRGKSPAEIERLWEAHARSNN